MRDCRGEEVATVSSLMLALVALFPVSLDGARGRAGLAHATCHELRHTCLTRLREAGMALEAVHAQAGHRSIETYGAPLPGYGGSPGVWPSTPAVVRDVHVH